MKTNKNQVPQSSVSVSFLSDENLQRCANLYAEQEMIVIQMIIMVIIMGQNRWE